MIEACELVDTELAAVCGGGVVDINFGNIVVNPQIATQIGFAIGGLSVFGNGGSAIVAQLLNQSGITSIGH
jgi:hypothetical protein